MSDVEGDLEFYTAFEDELYKETGSVNSDDDIDSELEAELYQNVHFASTFVVTPSSNVQEETDDPNKDEVIASSPVEEKLNCVDGKPASDSTSFTDGAPENGITKYPEVELVFSNDKKKATESKFKKDGVTPLSLLQSLGGVEDAWELHEADLMPAKSVNSKEKKRRSSMYVRCFNCNERGHRTFQCTQPKKEKVCCLCGLSGHIKQDCPNELCFNCHEPGHQLRQCRKARCRPGDTCRRCHAYGHFESICPDKWRQYHHTIKQGNVIQPEMKPLQNKVYCYNCGAEGHFGHECLEDNPDGRFADAFPFVVMYDRFTSCSPAVNNRHEQQDHHHTPNQNNHHHHHHHTPNQQHHTPNQQHHTPNQQHHTPNQHHHTSNQQHHTPNQHHHTPNQNRRLNHNQHQTQHLNGNGEKRSKRRKMEDHWGYENQAGDQGWGYNRDNWNMMEDHVNRLDHWGNLDFTETPELTTSFECDISPIQERKGKRKRKIKEAKGMFEVTLTEDKRRNGNNRNKKRKRKIEQGQNQEDLRTVINTWNTAPNKKKKKNKNKKAKLNQDALPPFRNFNPPPPAFHQDHSTASSFPRNQEKSFIQQNKRKRKESKKWRKSKNQQTANANNSRRVYYDFNGFV